MATVLSAAVTTAAVSALAVLVVVMIAFDVGVVSKLTADERLDRFITGYL